MTTTLTNPRNRRVSLLALSFILLGLLQFVSAPANASVKPGAKCSKVNQKAKVGKDSYVCTQNPNLKKKQLTWVWEVCIETNQYYLEAKSKYDQLSSNASKALSEIDAEILKLKSGAPADEAAAKVFDQKAVDARAKQERALGEAKIASDNATKAGATTTAGRTYSQAASQWTKAASSYGLAVKNFERSAKSLRDKVNEVANKEKDKLRVQQTIANVEVEVKSALDNRKTACKPGL